MTWEFQSDRPIYLQLVEQIELRIVSGCYALGEKLPSVRDLANEAAVNPNTMQRALSELERQNLVFSQRTSGRFITSDSNLVVQVKNSFAKTQIEDFLKKMRSLGFSKGDTVALMDTINEEDLT